MATIVNSPTPVEERSGSALGVVIALVVLLALAFLFFVFGMPYLRGARDSGTQLNVPDQIDVNVNQ